MRVEVETSKEIRPDQLAVECGSDIFTSEGRVQAEGITQQQLSEAVSAHVPDPFFAPAGPAKPWLDKVKAEIDFLTEQLASLPASLTNTQRDAALRRLIRNQIRILKFVHNNTKDAG